MSQQNSQKHGTRSDAQKTRTARNDYEPIPPANPVAGALVNDTTSQSDQDLASQWTRNDGRLRNPTTQSI